MSEALFLAASSLVEFQQPAEALTAPSSLRFLEFRSHLDACVYELTAGRVVAMDGQAVVAHDDGLGQRVSQRCEVVRNETSKHSHPVAVKIDLRVLIVMELERNQGELCRVGAERPSNPDVARAPFGADDRAGRARRTKSAFPLCPAGIIEARLQPFGRRRVRRVTP